MGHAADTGGESWIERFEGLAGLPEPIRDTLIARSKLVTLPAGARVFGPGNVPESLLLLVEGTVRVSQTSESGREIVLYRVEAGESCVLTTACLLAHEAYLAEGIAETDLRAVAIPRTVFDELISRSTEFRDFVLAAYARRITDLFRVVDDVAFGKIDMRLAGRLLELAGGADGLQVTHQQLATELGTAREVVSRQLSEFQRRGWIALSRGRVAITDAAALRRLAESG
ncbi:MAG: Crp/Fnr family transcriptional regulator [Alphaproteobacteria bacterium]|nr:MAG: Crp/Fnr family transcriptional regulator [Alphaproteobacteria bacterium]